MSSQQVRGKGEMPGAEVARLTDMAVSYTHLDVYKRQTFLRADPTSEQ